MSQNMYICFCIFTSAFVSYLIRVLPLTLIRKPIKNTFIRSFLYYVPYVTLAAMTFPAIIECTSSKLAGILALIVGIIVSYLGAGLLPVASICCLVVFVTELII